MGLLLDKAIRFKNSWIDSSGVYTGRHFISIIIPTYHPEHLHEVISHVNGIAFGQEIIIVDDSESQVLRNQTLPDNIKVVYHSHNLGRSAARNTGAAFAHGDILVFMDQDMLLHPSFLSDIQALMSGNRMNAVVLGLRDTIGYESVRGLERWPDLSPYRDWRRCVHVSPDFIDTTATGIGSAHNHCATNDCIDIIEATDGLRKLGVDQERTIGFWDLAGLVISHSMAIPTKAFFEIGGFPDWISGWGGEDIVLGFLAIAHEMYIIPTDRVSIQIYHEPYSGSVQAKRQELARNMHAYRTWAHEATEFSRINRREWIERAKLR